MSVHSRIVGEVSSSWKPGDPNSNLCNNFQALIDEKDSAGYDLEVWHLVVTPISNAAAETYRVIETIVAVFVKRE